MTLRLGKRLPVGNRNSLWYLNAVTHAPTTGDPLVTIDKISSRILAQVFDTDVRPISIAMDSVYQLVLEKCKWRLKERDGLNGFRKHAMERTRWF